MSNGNGFMPKKVIRWRIKFGVAASTVRRHLFKMDGGKN